LFVFSGLGLSMIFLSQVYLKLNAYRKSSLLMDYASENGIKRGLADLTEWLESRGGCAPVSASRHDAFLESPRTGFPALLAEALGGGFPRLLQESFEGLSWDSLSTCGFESIDDRGTYSFIRTSLVIESSGALIPLRPKRLSSLEASMGFLAGNLPLAAVPLLIDKTMTEPEKSGFLQANSISFLAKKSEALRPQAAITEGGVISQDTGHILGRALNVKIFSPQDLSTAKLRQALGLEPSEESVPDGVYLIRNDLGLGGVYIQGDVDEMVMAIDGDAQDIVFRTAAGEWALEFSPARSQTEFRTPAAVESYDLVPLGIIIVNGKILSLGGGIVESDGTVRMVKDEEIPSVLGGVGLTIVCSDRITLTSHLILQNVRWQEGFPYIKDAQSQVVVFSSGRDILSGDEREGGIAVDAAAPAALKLQATLTAAGGGFEIQGSGKSVELLGALHAGDYAANGNSLRIAPDARTAAGRFPADSPVTATPRLAVCSFKIRSWKEY
jgi:hypothetical protein